MANVFDLSWNADTDAVPASMMVLTAMRIAAKI